MKARGQKMQLGVDIQRLFPEEIMFLWELLCFQPSNTLYANELKIWVCSPLIYKNYGSVRV
jgi:hypothetical protein